jgi:exonuclease III
MKIMCWNCQGLRNPNAVRELCHKVKDKCPDLVFLMETKLHRNKMDGIRRTLNYENMLIVDCIGRSGALAMLWREGLGIEVQNYNNRHINAKVSPFNERAWFFIGFYGHPEWHKRGEAWSLLKHLKMMIDGPWVCAGDFNEILDNSEKVGGGNDPIILWRILGPLLNFVIYMKLTAGDPCGLGTMEEGEKILLWRDLIEL